MAALRRDTGSDGATSSMPMLKPQLVSQRVHILVSRCSARAATLGELSRMSTYTSPRLEPLPMHALSMLPAMSAPSRNTTKPSSAHMYAPRPL